MGLGRLLSHPLVVAGLQSGALFTQQMQKDREEEEKLRREMRLKSFEYQQKNLDAERSRQQQLEQQTQQLNIDVLKGAMGSNDLEKYGPAKAAVEALRRTNNPEYMAIADQFEAPMLENEAALKKAQADAAKAQADAAKATNMEEIRNAYKSIVTKVENPGPNIYKAALSDLQGRLRIHPDFQDQFQTDIDELKNQIQDAEVREKAEDELVGAVGSGSVYSLDATVNSVKGKVSRDTFSEANKILAGWKREPVKAEQEKLLTPAQIKQRLSIRDAENRIDALTGKGQSTTNVFIGGDKVAAGGQTAPNAGAGGGWQAKAEARLRGGGGGVTAPADSIIAQTERQARSDSLRNAGGESQPTSVSPATMKPALPAPPAPPAGQWQDQFAVTGPRPGIFDTPAAPASGARAAFFARQGINGAAAVPAPADTLAAPASIQVTAPWRATPADAAGLDPVDISAIEKYAQVKGLTFAQAKTELDSLATGVP